eukprot:4556577-Prymnesium_polylepis.1
MVRLLKQLLRPRGRSETVRPPPCRRTPLTGAPLSPWHVHPTRAARARGGAAIAPVLRPAAQPPAAWRESLLRPAVGRPAVEACRRRRACRAAPPWWRAGRCRRPTPPPGRARCGRRARPTV